MYSYILLFIEFIWFFIADAFFTNVFGSYKESKKRVFNNASKGRLFLNAVLDSILSMSVILIAFGIPTIIVAVLHCSSKNYVFDNVTTKVESRVVEYSVEIVSKDKIKDIGEIYTVRLEPNSPLDGLDYYSFLSPYSDYNKYLLSRAGNSGMTLHLKLNAEEYEDLIGVDCTILRTTAHILRLESKGNLGQKYNARLVRLECLEGSDYSTDEINSLSDAFLSYCNEEKATGFATLKDTAFDYSCTIVTCKKNILTRPNWTKE